jgi:tetratricopeptide (TPR) repeat protein
MIVIGIDQYIIQPKFLDDPTRDKMAPRTTTSLRRDGPPPLPPSVPRSNVQQQSLSSIQRPTIIVPSKDGVNNNYYETLMKESNRLHDLGIDLYYGNTSPTPNTTSSSGSTIYSTSTSTSTTHPKVDHALSALYHAVHIREAMVGKFHPDTALSYSRIASILYEYQQQKSCTATTTTTTPVVIAALEAGRRELRITHELLKCNKNSTIAEIDEHKDGWIVQRLTWFQQVLENCGDSIDTSNNEWSSSSSSGGGATTTTASQQRRKKYCSQLLQSIAMEQLGDQYVTIQQWEVAITHYNNALTLESNSLGKNIVDSADIHMKIADCAIQIQDYDTAMDELLTAERKFRQAFPPLVASSSSSTTTTLLSSSSSSATTTLSSRQYQYHDHRTVGDVYSKIGKVLVLQHQFDDALAMHAKAYTIYEATYGKTHQRTKDVIADMKVVTVREMEHLRYYALKNNQSSIIEQNKRG